MQENSIEVFELPLFHRKSTIFLTFCENISKKRAKKSNKNQEMKTGGKTQKSLEM